MKFPYLLFDADDTLFDYSRAERSALERTCEAFGGATAFRIRWIPAPSTTGSTRSCGQPLTGERSPRTM